MAIPLRARRLRADRPRSPPDVDLVNELAQQKRLERSELGEHAIRAVDRGYLLRPGDVVAVRNAAYTFDTQPGRPRPKRVENGQVAIVDSVDTKRDTRTLLLREPGAEPRLVEIDQAKLRAEHAAGRRAAAIRLNYAMHSFPAQGATVQASATLAGHWSQAKRETYVGDTRAIYRHTVHVAREDLGLEGTDEDRINRYAQRISENRQRQASIHSALDPTLQLAVHLPDHQPIPGHGALTEAPGPSDPSPEASPTRDTSPPTAAPAATGDTSPETSPAADARRQQRTRAQEHLSHVLDGPPDHLLRALGAPPEDRVARERWEREARRLEALRFQSQAKEQPASSPPPPSRGASTGRQGPSTPPAAPQRRGGLTIGR